jgi:hypothetical protein
MTAMTTWYQSDEFEMPLWVFDLDDHIYSTDHRRLCVWFDELEAVWKWEIQTYQHSGVVANGSTHSENSSKIAAETAARELARVDKERLL